MKVNKYVNVVAPSLEPDKEGILNIKLEPSVGNWVENYCIIKENYMFCFKEHPALCENAGAARSPRSPRTPSGRGMLQQMSEASLKTLGLAQSFSHNDDRRGKPIVFPLEEAHVSSKEHTFTIWHDEPQGTGCFFKAHFNADNVHTAAAWARHIQACKSSIQKEKLQQGMARNKQMVEDMAQRVKTMNKKHQEQLQLQRVLDAERSLYLAVQKQNQYLKLEIDTLHRQAQSLPVTSNFKDVHWTTMPSSLQPTLPSSIAKPSPVSPASPAPAVPSTSPHTPPTSEPSDLQDASNCLGAGSPPEPQLVPFLSLPEKTWNKSDRPQSAPSTSKTSSAPSKGVQQRDPSEGGIEETDVDDGASPPEGKEGDEIQEQSILSPRLMRLNALKLNDAQQQAIAESSLSFLESQLEDPQVVGQKRSGSELFAQHASRLIGTDGAQDGPLDQSRPRGIAFEMVLTRDPLPPPRIEPSCEEGYPSAQNEGVPEEEEEDVEMLLDEVFWRTPTDQEAVSFDKHGELGPGAAMLEVFAMQRAGAAMITAAHAPCQQREGDAAEKQVVSLFVAEPVLPAKGWWSTSEMAPDPKAEGGTRPFSLSNLRRQAMVSAVGRAEDPKGWHSLETDEVKAEKGARLRSSAVERHNNVGSVGSREDWSNEVRHNVVVFAEFVCDDHLIGELILKPTDCPEDLRLKVISELEIPYDFIMELNNTQLNLLPRDKKLAPFLGKGDQLLIKKKLETQMQFPP